MLGFMFGFGATELLILVAIVIFVGLWLAVGPPRRK
jgi:hypothetical protein